MGVCLQLPLNCGQEDARCCPPGIYGPPESPRNVTGFSCEGKDIKCSGWGGMPGKRRWTDVACANEVCKSTSHVVRTSGQLALHGAWLA